MPPMTERFEMRLDEDTLELIDGWRRDQPDAPSRAEAIRRLVNLALDRQVAGRPTLTSGERLTMVMLCDVLRMLRSIAPKAKPEINPDFVSEAVWSGHLWGLRWQYPGVFDGEEPDKELITEVGEFLDMWWVLENHHVQLTAANKKELAARSTLAKQGVKFFGFDGNEENRHLSIAHFLIDHLDRFTYFSGRDLNSHFPAVERYRAMHSRFRKTRRDLMGGPLSVEQLATILDAWET